MEPIPDLGTRLPNLPGLVEFVPLLAGGFGAGLREEVRVAKEP
jgi:hypothetical protein